MRRPCSSLNSRSCCLRRASLVAAALVSRASADVVQGLGSADGAYAWTLRNANGSLAVPATVPGAALLDLVRAGLAPEPYAGTNVDALGWVKREAWWTWTLEFDAEPALLGSARVELVAEGVDTVADVTFNGEELWVQDSAFVRTVVDVTATLRAAGNVLSIRIFSPTAAALAANASCAGYCPSAEWGPVTNRSGYDQAFQYLRKAGCHFGWDFAPNLAPSGVWRSIILRGYDGATLDDVSVVTAPAGGGVVPLGDGGSPWTAVVTAHVVVVPPAGSGTVGVTVTVAVTGLPGGHGSTHAVLAAGARDVAVSLALPSARAWWPAGVGAPALYPANVTVVVDGAAPGARGTSARALDLAFRTVAVRRPAVPGGNASALMFFEVNGQAIFFKGANWVPPDAFPTRAAGRAQLAPKIAALAAAGYTGVRVWGGGHPMSDAFYELAQESGLLVWHEMPYACAGYPTGGARLAGAAAEAANIVRRLQKFSIALWGGNNEVAQVQARYLTPGSFASSNYSALFFGAVGSAVVAADASRVYVPTSPGSGAETAAAPVAIPAQAPARGDEHVYVYDGDCLDATRYPRPRAASEFGWQSLPTFLSMAELVSPAQFDFWAPAVTRRDTHGSQPPATILFHNVGMNWLIPGYNGSSATPPGARDARLAGAAAAAAAAARAAGATSTAYTARPDGTFALPTDALGLVPAMRAFGGVGPAVGTVFRDTLYMTQVAHAACLRAEAEAYRRAQSTVTAEGGGTSTILYWMANELWPAATKASVEWSGRWKATHYEAARGFLAPLLLSAWSVPLNASSPASAAPFGVALSAHAPAALAGAVPAGVLRLTCWSWADGRLGDYDAPFAIPEWPAAWGARGASLAAGGAVELLPPGTTLADALGLCGCAPPRAPAECALEAAAFDSPAPPPPPAPLGAELARTWLFPVPLREVRTMRDPGLRVTDVEPVPGEPGAFDVTLDADALPAAAVWIESALCCGHFGDNNFLLTRAPVTLRYTPGADARGWAHAPPPGAETNVTAGQLAASLSVWSLFDVVAGYSSATAAAAHAAARAA